MNRIFVITFAAFFLGMWFLFSAHVAEHSLEEHGTDSCEICFVQKHQGHSNLQPFPDTRSFPLAENETAHNSDIPTADISRDASVTRAPPFLS